MRKPCLACVYKHLADAAIWEIEYHLGYPNFKLYIIGSLNHASHEAFKAYPDLAWLIREHRIRWFDKPATYQVPYEPLAAFLEVCMQVPESGVLPDIPDSCKAGIDSYSLDTRPD